MDASGRFPLDYEVLINFAVMPVGELPSDSFDVAYLIRRGAILSICGQYCLRGRDMGSVWQGRCEGGKGGVGGRGGCLG